MSVITGDEPSHWHDATGKHLPIDPREYRWWRSHGPGAIGDERAYAAHLDRHEHLASRQPQPDDPPTVQAAFAQIALLRQRVEELYATIATLRLGAQTPLAVVPTDIGAGLTAATELTMPA